MSETTEGKKSCSFAWARRDRRENFTVENWVAGTYTARAWSVVSVTWVTRGRLRILMIFVLGRGVELAWNVRCGCADCRRKFWRRIFFMRAHEVKKDKTQN
jgi:hypothetical protein